MRLALLAAWLALPVLAQQPGGSPTVAVKPEAAPVPALTTAQKLEWKDAILKAVQAENATHRLKEQAEREIQRLTAEQQKATQEAQVLAAKLVKDSGAASDCTLTIDGEVKCPEKPGAKK